MAFTDDFERGSLGADWADDGPVFFADGWARADNFLSGGTWQSADADSELPDAAMASIRRTTDACTDQFIEAEVGNFFQGYDPGAFEYQQYVEGEIFLFAQLAPGSNAGIGVDVIINAGLSGAATGLGKAFMQIITVAEDGEVTYLADGDTFPLTGWQTNPNYVIRLEVTAAGHCRAYFEGSLLVEDDVTPLGGHYVGIGMEWNKTNYNGSLPTNPGQSFQVEWVTGSLCGSTWNIGFVGPSRT